VRAYNYDVLQTWAEGFERVDGIIVEEEQGTVKRERACGGQRKLDVHAAAGERF
jgi:hypothetical protein